MSKKILLTSFTTWLPHQKSNSSDNLLIEIAQTGQNNPSLATSHSLTFLRHLPVDVEKASSRAISQIDLLQPDIIICCGMAEKRPILTVESNASLGNHLIENWIDVHKLISDLKVTEISHEAGKFVCEALYYSALKYLRDRQLNSRCIFVHVPILTPDNLSDIRADFSEIINRLVI